MESIVIQRDIEELVSQKEYFEPFENTSIVVTGATGLIGSILIKSLIKYGNIQVYACCRDENKFNSVFKDYKSDFLIPVYSDISSLDLSNISYDYVVHCASITDSKTFVEKPVETINIAIDGTRNLLSQCLQKKIKGFLYLSSLEVYGSFDSDSIKNVRESDFGFIDCMSIRSSYSEGKRMVENICKSYQVQYNLPIKIARLCQTFGAGVSYTDNRVFAQFARAAIEEKDIVLKTKGDTVRNYCYITDAVSGILTILAKGQIGEAYNIANMQTTISISNMAEMVCDKFGGNKIKLVFDIVEDVTKLGYNPTVKIQLDSKKLSNLGWKPIVTLEEMFSRLIKYLREGK